MNKQIIKKIIEKKEFSQLPLKDVELALSQFDKERYSDIEKIKLTRDLLRKVFSGFTSQKLLSLKDKPFEWILRKHLSTRERLSYYNEVYMRLLGKSNKKINIFDLGAGINGFSFNFFKELGFNVKYIAVEAMGQLVDLMNDYFKRDKLNAKAIHLSLFESEKIKKLIKNEKGMHRSVYPKTRNSGTKIIFLFKALDSLEMLERNYSKKLLQDLVPLADKIVVSFATRSMIRRSKFRAKRNWIINFIKENFNILDDFEIGGERYIIFSSGKDL